MTPRNGSTELLVEMLGQMQAMIARVDAAQELLIAATLSSAAECIEQRLATLARDGDAI